MIKSKHVSEEIQWVVLAYVDDMDFCKKGTDDGSKMQEIVDYYSSMHEATGVKVQKEKGMILRWKWKSNQIGEAVIKVVINGKIIKRIDVKHSIKTVGICFSPRLSWKKRIWVCTVKNEKISQKVNHSRHKFVSSTFLF